MKTSSRILLKIAALVLPVGSSVPIAIGLQDILPYPYEHITSFVSEMGLVYVAIRMWIYADKKHE